MKILKWVVVAIVLLIVVIVVTVLFSLDGLIRSTVQSQATSSLNLTTTLGGAHLSILGGSLSLDDLAIASPQGFTAPQMFALGKAGLQVNYGQLRNQPVHINAITLEKPKLVVEQANGKLNLQALTSQSSKTPTDSSGKPAEPMKLVIDKLTITGADVTVMPGIPGMDKPIDITVPEIDMANIGNDGSTQNGLAIKDVAAKVISAIANKCADSDKLPPEVKVLLSGNFSGLQDAAKQQLDSALNGVKSGNTDDLKKSADGFKNLLGGKK